MITFEHFPSFSTVTLSETHRPPKHTHSWLACCLSLVHMLLFQQRECGSGAATRLPTLLDSWHSNWTQRKRGPLDKAKAVSPPIPDLQASHLEWLVRLPPRDYTICAQCVGLRYLQISAFSHENWFAVGSYIFYDDYHYSGVKNIF